MAGLLGVLALVVFVFGLVNLLRPTGWLGMSSRRRAGMIVGASFVLFLVAASIDPPDPDGGPTSTTLPGSLNGPTTTDGAGATTTTLSSPTTTPDTTITSEPPVSDQAFVAPSAGPSGDPNGPIDPSAEVVMVVEVIDGDTIDLFRANGERETVRLIGINAPERGECWSSEAASVLTVLTSFPAEIGLTVDESDRDRFERLLRYLWVGSMSVNEELVRRGAALSRRYPPDIAQADRLDAAQEEARTAARGVWAPDACGASSDADMRIVDWRPDAAGDDTENLNDEWIRIRNEGESAVDLTGWGIRDESATNRYSFPSGFSLVPGEEATVHSGCGDDFDTSLYWCSVGSAIWNNDGDTAFLTDPAGNTHTHRSYTP